MWWDKSGLESGVRGYLIAWLDVGIGRGEEGEIGEGIEEHWENGYPPVRDARLPVTQPNDPPDLVISGGHLSVGTLKTPPGPAREGSVIVMQV